MPLTKGQQRTRHLGDMAPTSPLPRVRVCQAGWLPITPWPICTLPDWMEWRRALSVEFHTFPRQPLFLCS